MIIFRVSDSRHALSSRLLVLGKCNNKSDEMWKGVFLSASSIVMCGAVEEFSAICSNVTSF